MRLIQVTAAASVLLAVAGLISPTRRSARRSCSRTQFRDAGPAVAGCRRQRPGQREVDAFVGQRRWSLPAAPFVASRVAEDLRSRPAIASDCPQRRLFGGLSFPSNVDPLVDLDRLDDREFGHQLDRSPEPAGISSSRW